MEYGGRKGRKGKGQDRVTTGRELSGEDGEGVRTAPASVASAHLSRLVTWSPGHMVTCQGSILGGGVAALFAMLALNVFVLIEPVWSCLAFGLLARLRVDFRVARLILC